MNYEGTSALYIDDMHRWTSARRGSRPRSVTRSIRDRAGSFTRGDLNVSKRFEFLQSRVTPRVSHASRARLATSRSGIGTSISSFFSRF